MTTTEKETAYKVALTFVDAIEPDPRTRRLAGHWRNRAGALLRTLGEVIDAYLAGDLLLPEDTEPAELARAV